MKIIINLILAILILIGIYAICAFVVWTPLIMEWPVWVRGVYAFWVLVAVNKALDKNK
mgnify:FL=1